MSATPLPDLMQGLDRVDAERLLALGQRFDVASGQPLFRLGAPADRLFVIERGRIALRLPIQVGGRREELVIEELGPGQTVGWSALIPPHRFTLEAVASVDATVLALTREALAEYFENFPAIGYAVTQNVASVVGQRLGIVQAMWLREMQRMVQLRYA
jgi:CRP-like cAMP-binding protein